MHAQPAPSAPFLQAFEHEGQPLEIEAQWLNAEAGADRPLIVFLHEGLGSLSQWRDFPRQLCQATRCRGLLFSRPGYGRSTPRRDPWPQDYLQRQARGLLPACFAALGLREDEKLLLFGHSDGASLALLFASYYPARTLGVVAMAPHLFVEPVTSAGLRAAKQAFEREGSPLRAALNRHHAEVDSAFYGWNDAWLRPGFEQWNIEGELGGLACPVLALQGEGDEYGTLAQIRAVGRLHADTRVCALGDCGHAPQRDQPEAVIRETQALLARCGG